MEKPKKLINQNDDKVKSGVCAQGNFMLKKALQAS